MVQRVVSILTSDGRRAWAFAAICGGCIVFTLFAAVGVYLVAGDLRYTFYLAVAAHLQILIGMSALGFVLGRRMSLDATRNGVKFSDQDGSQTVTATATIKSGDPDA